MSMDTCKSASVVAAQLLRKAIPHGVVFAFGGIEHTAGFEVGKNTRVAMPFADAHFVYAHAGDLAHFQLLMRLTHVSL